MQNQKQYLCTLNEKDLDIIGQLLNAFPLGNMTVQQASSSANHAQQIIQFLNSKTQEIAPKADS